MLDVQDVSDSPVATAPLDLARLDDLSDADLDAAPFGIIALNAQGVVERYNLAESRLARLDRAQVLGRSFFKTVAPCTATPEFQGRWAAVAGNPAAAPVQFSYVFDFKFGAQDVEVEVLRGSRPGRTYLVINRRRFLPMRPQPVDFLAPLQSELAPQEAAQGVLRSQDASVRSIHVTPAFLQAMRSTWDRVAPKGWPLFCHEWGQQWGRLAIVDLETAALERSGKSLRELPMREVMDMVGAYLQRQGWGLWSADFSAQKQGAFVLTLDRNALAEAVGFSDTARCQLMAGFMRGIMSHLAGRLIHVREVCCQAQGHPRCEFVAVGATRKAVLDAALQDGTDRVATVMERLAAAGAGHGPRA